MRAENDPVKRAIAGLAARQHGVVGRWQLLELGCRTSAIGRMADAGYLHRIHRGAYAVGHARLTARGRTMAAVLACGPEAMASHLTAAWLLGILSDSRARTDVSVPSRRGGGTHATVILHRPRALRSEDRTLVDGIPCTALPRTLLDIAATRPQLLRRAFEEAERRRILDLRAIHALLARTGRHRGHRRLAALVAAQAGPPPRTRSQLEEAFLALVRTEELPMPQMNVLVGGFEVDALWPEHGLAVEIDHYATHGHRTAFERDRERDAELQIAGLKAIRVTDTQIDERTKVAGRLRRLLA